MERLKPPSELSFEGSVSKNWKVWKKTFQFFLDATEINEKSNKVKTSTLLTCIGPKGREIYDSFSYAADGDNMKLDKVLEKFDEYCEPRKNTTMARHKFLTHRQLLG